MTLSINVASKWPVSSGATAPPLPPTRKGERLLKTSNSECALLSLLPDYVSLYPTRELVCMLAIINAFYVAGPAVSNLDLHVILDFKLLGVKNSTCLSLGVGGNK